MVALLAPHQNNRLFCGGVLINEWFVLTAAHCLNEWVNIFSTIGRPLFLIDWCLIDSKQADEVTVRLGEFHFRWPSLSRRDHTIDNFYIHDKFNSKTFDNDIAIIKLNERADVRDTLGNIWPICLPPPGVQLDTKYAYVAGKVSDSNFHRSSGQ